MSSTQPPRALVIAPQPFFTPRGTPFSVYYRTSVLSELGVHVDLLTYGQGEDVDLPNVRIVRIPDFRVFGKIKTGPSGLKFFLDGFILVWTIAMLLRRRYTFVHAHEESVFFCRYLKPVFRFRLLYDMHSSLPQQLDNFQFTKSRVIRKVFEYLENTSLRSADAVITICKDLADYVESVIGDDPKHLLIENSIFEPVRLASKPDAGSDGPARAELPADRRFIVYAGTFERYQGLDILIEAFATVRKNVPDAYLLMIGGDKEQVEALRSMADGLGINDSVTFTGRVPQADAKYYNGRADVLVSPRSAGTNTPLKVYEQLASGIPLVATRIYSHTQVLSDDDCFLVEPDSADMARGIIEALTNSEAVRERIANAQSLYEEKYSRAAYVRKMKLVLERLT